MGTEHEVAATFNEGDCPLPTPQYLYPLHQLQVKRKHSQMCQQYQSFYLLGIHFTAVIFSDSQAYLDQAELNKAQRDP